MKIKHFIHRYFPNVPLMLLDFIILALSLFIGICFRVDFNFSLVADSIVHYAIGLPLLFFLTVTLFYVMGIYKIIWTYPGINNVFKTAFCTIFPYILLLFCQSITFDYLQEINSTYTRVPISAYFIAIPISILLILSFRLLLRPRTVAQKKADRSHPIVIIGAGEGGNYLYHTLISNPNNNYNPVGFIDDDPDKIGKKVSGLTVLGNRHNIQSIVEKHEVRSIFIAMPSCPQKDKTEIVNICAQTGCNIKILPSLDESLLSPSSRLKLRDININDLLGRDPINIDHSALNSFIRAKTILVTGAGGSIGSELCRQLASLSPKKLVLFDIYENTTYEILQELKRNYPDLDVVALIGSMRDEVMLDNIFSAYRPEIVYHAAAHKHVPLMEASPNEAIKNNVLGTLRVVRAADKYGVSRFLLISTDKAVNPTNIMGATKRICEMIVQTYNQKSKTEYVAVRFGNVLGSNGSVIPLFKQQIAAGGPVTVTHPDIIRYFMTIPEAVSLVLTAGMSAAGGEIFVLDMGNPVKILDLATNLIRLSGYQPYKEIDIIFTGLRPGEKLYEELLMDEEGLQSTMNKLIFIGKRIELDEEEFFSQLRELEEAANHEDPDIRTLVQKIVPTYHPSGI